MKRTILAALAAVALIIGLSTGDAYASQAGPGHCAGVARTLAYPAYQLQDFSVNKPWGPIYIFQNAPILLYHDVNGNENFYGFYLGWVSVNRVYQDYFTWPAQPGQSSITTVPPINNGDFIFVEIAISQTYQAGNCIITNP